MLVPANIDAPITVKVLFVRGQELRVALAPLPTQPLTVNDVIDGGSAYSNVFATELPPLALTVTLQVPLVLALTPFNVQLNVLASGLTTPVQVGTGPLPPLNDTAITLYKLTPPLKIKPPPTIGQFTSAAFGVLEHKPNPKLLNDGTAAYEILPTPLTTPPLLMMLKVYAPLPATAPLNEQLKLVPPTGMIGLLTHTALPPLNVTFVGP
jgi:hypothetical protein